MIQTSSPSSMNIEEERQRKLEFLLSPINFVKKNSSIKNLEQILNDNNNKNRKIQGEGEKFRKFTVEPIEIAMKSQCFLENIEKFNSKSNLNNTQTNIFNGLNNNANINYNCATQVFGRKKIDVHKKYLNSFFVNYSQVKESLHQQRKETKLKQKQIDKLSLMNRKLANKNDKNIKNDNNNNNSFNVQNLTEPSLSIGQRKINIFAYFLGQRLSYDERKEIFKNLLLEYSTKEEKKDSRDIYNFFIGAKKILLAENTKKDEKETKQNSGTYEQNF